MPQLGATFVPGGFDDYYMPEVIAPAPQRVMPEVPQHMQEDLQRMELEAREVDRKGSNPAATPGPDQYARHPAGEDFVNNFKPFVAHSNPANSIMDTPSFSPFPKVKGENIPPSDEEKGEILWSAREHVLNSNNVPMQISWARDALMWVEISAERQERDLKRDGKTRERPQTPKMEHELRVDAVNIIEHLAQQGHPDATFMRAKWQEFGKFGHRENKREAYFGYKKAADLGFGRAEYRMGMLYENSNDSDKAIKHYQQGVQMQDSASYYRLGMLYLMGQLGHAKDYEQGLVFIQKAADKADEDAPQGAYVYGMLIARELPDIAIPEGMLPYELVVAKQYVEKAAYLGFAKAQLKMGQAYELGQLGCDFNPANSLHYYGLAAHQGQPEAALGVSRWFLFGFEGVFPKNEQLAFKYAQEAASAGLATGEFAMGYYYEIGIHVPKDIREAQKWYDLAAEHGNKDAKARIDSLSQSKTLTKKDHETTTLTRIKSQHGSQRGKRPDRFAKQNDVMPTLSESDNGPPVPGKGAHADFPDPSRHSTMTRPPAFTVNLDGANLAHRPQSAAPYPEDDRPPPLTLRPKSAAPYPEDDLVGHKPPLSPHYNPSIRPSAGPQADRPASAFGVRPVSPNGGPNLQPNADYRGRMSLNASSGTGWEPQLPSGYRQASPSPARQDPYRMSGGQLPPPQQQPQQPYYNQSAQRLSSAPVPAGAPIGDPTRNRLQKTNPAPPKPQQGPPPGQFPMAGYGTDAGGAQPGRDYGPRTSSRPVSDSYDRYGAMPPANNGRLPPAGGSIRPERMDSLPQARPPSGGLPPKPRPPHMDAMAGRSSAPPAQGPRPGVSPGPSSGVTSPASVASTTNLPGHASRPAKIPTDHPDGKTMGQGPATFEAMGIPQGKNDNDCVVM
ncbi:HCP-like protein [Thozetella sp. PMI_491]|nr:HCP-like protein [Thozetella sp. PMI_491]